MTHRSIWLIVALCLTALCQDTTTSVPDSLSSAVSLSASLAVESARSSLIQPIPTPETFSVPDGDVFASLVSAWPPIQTGSVPVSDASLRSIIEDITANETDSAPLEKRAGVLRIMIVGDSMTQGAEGDWTWRYRLWQWFKTNNIQVDSVGPYSGTIAGLGPSSPPQPPPLYGSSSPIVGPSVWGRYALDVDPGFDSDHFAAWGRPVAMDMSLIEGFVSQFQPDFLLVMLGFNDLGWFYSDENGLVQNMKTFIDNARKPKPNIKFAIANVPQREWLGRQDLVDKTDRYNSMLPGKLTEWSTPTSPCAHVELRHAYTCEPAACRAGYDGLHPNALGDFQIASAFTNTLKSVYGMGNEPLSVPADVPRRPVGIPPNFQVSSTIYGVTATWDAVFGAFGYDVQVSINDGPWQSSVAKTNRYDTTWPFDGSTYAIRVRTNCGKQDYLQSPWTATLSAKATPKLALPPRNVKTYATETGLTITFDPPTGPNTDSIVEYNIIWWDLDAKCAFITGAAFKNSPAHIDNLTPGHRFLIAPTTWNNAGMGFPVGGRNVKVGSTIAPGRPPAINVVTADANNVYITWQEQSNAAGYSIWTRNTLNASDTLQVNYLVTQPCWSQFIYYPAAWYWEYCVSAWNGNRDSGYGAAQCSKPPAASKSIAPAPTCPAGPQWCPEFYNPAPVPPGAGQQPPVTQTLSYRPTATYVDGPTATAVPSGGWANGDDYLDFSYQTCSLDSRFSNLDSLNSALATRQDLKSNCVGILAIDALVSMAQVAYDNYTSVDNGYDAEFGYYISYIKRLVPNIINWQLMYTPGRGANARPEYGPALQYFSCSKDPSGSPTFPCSDSLNQIKYSQVWFTLVDRDGWLKAHTQAGLLPDWITYGDYTITYTGIAARVTSVTMHGFPVLNDKLVVSNPKDLVTKGLTNIPSLIGDMECTYMDMLLGTWTTRSNVDPMQAYSTPVFLLMQAVDSMAQVKALGQQEEKTEQQEERDRVKNLVLTILGIAFLFVPIVGPSAAAAAGLSNLAKVLTAIATVGDIALTIYSIADDPSSAFANILGLVFGLGALKKLPRDGKGIATIAGARAAMSAAEVSGLGKIFSKQSEVMTSVAKACRR